MQNKFDELYKQSKQADCYGGIYSLREDLIKGKKKFMEQQLEELKMKLNEPDKKQIEEERKLVREKRTDKVQFMKEKTQIFLSNMRIQEKDQQIQYLEDYIKQEEKNLAQRQEKLKKNQDELKNGLDEIRQDLKKTKQILSKVQIEKDDILREYQQLQSDIHQKEMYIRKQNMQKKKLQKLKEFVEDIYQMNEKKFDLKDFLQMTTFKKTFKPNQKQEFFLTQNINRKFNKFTDPVKEFQNMIKNIQDQNLNYINSLQNQQMDFQQAENQYLVQKVKIEDQDNIFDKNIDKLMKDERQLDIQIQKKKALLQSICQDNQDQEQITEEKQMSENDYIEFLLQIFQSINFPIGKSQDTQQLLQVLQVNFHKLAQNCDLIQSNMQELYNDWLKKYVLNNKKENRALIADKQKRRIRRSNRDIEEKLQHVKQQKQQRTDMKKFIIKKSDKKNTKKKTDENEMEDLKYFY